MASCLRVLSLRPKSPITCRPAGSAKSRRCFAARCANSPTSASLVPGYRQVLDRAGASSRSRLLPGLASVPPCALGRTQTADGIPVYVPQRRPYDRPGGLYLDPDGVDWPDNDIRFARLSLAAAEIAAGTGDPNWKPDNLHLNDWPRRWRRDISPGAAQTRRRCSPSTISPIRARSIRRACRRSVFQTAAYRVDGVEFYGRLSFPGPASTTPIT